MPQRYSETILGAAGPIARQEVENRMRFAACPTHLRRFFARALQTRCRFGLALQKSRLFRNPPSLRTDSVRFRIAVCVNQHTVTGCAAPTQLDWRCGATPGHRPGIASKSATVTPDDRRVPGKARYEGF